MDEILRWVKAAKSGGSGGNCVEVGCSAEGHALGIRDSKRPHDGHLAVSTDTFAALLGAVKQGELDLP